MQLLNSTEQEFRRHRCAAGANLVWNVAYQSVAAAAKQENLPYGNEQEAYDAAAQLDRIQQGSLCIIGCASRQPPYFAYQPLITARTATDWQ